ncbi:MAG: DUF1501 domain-containing protein [Planctomycetes bacterium]|nr:DUF1501 domain-containing protein [Planctomycetota bacterium]
MSPSRPCHPIISRRTMVQAGSLGLLGLGMNHVAALRAADVVSTSHSGGSAKSVIFVFLSGGLRQHDSFDPKPEAPADIRGEFSSIATKTPGVRICEHLLDETLIVMCGEMGRTPKVNALNRSPGCAPGRDHVERWTRAPL